jgi:hypothetical protein
MSSEYFLFIKLRELRPKYRFAGGFKPRRAGIESQICVIQKGYYFLKNI